MTRSRPFLPQTVPPGSTPTPTPTPTPAAASAQALGRLTSIAKVSMQTLASLAKHSVDLTWATLAGNLDRASANKAYLESVTRESAQYWRDVGGLGVGCATDLVTLGKSVSTSILREMAASRDPGIRPASGAAASTTESLRHHVRSEGGSPQPMYSPARDRGARSYPVPQPAMRGNGERPGDD